MKDPPADRSASCQILAARPLVAQFPQPGHPTHQPTNRFITQSPTPPSLTGRRRQTPDDEPTSQLPDAAPRPAANLPTMLDPPHRQEPKAPIALVTVPSNYAALARPWITRPPVVKALRVMPRQCPRNTPQQSLDRSKRVSGLERDRGSLSVLVYNHVPPQQRSVVHQPVSPSAVKDQVLV
ncbi:hypothetical protein BDK51DRAFT_49056 [Blyttiomyces helicus]|uniref:Uncharacterized protein n=1 Tax=Blyttiomyces helicus TaxID=388810 RepID=A0A4P9W305_9FUNG|nr:hypothetical protein BDK51DRAFT_49056 [Blyttiomyces helicus]|eukprot:RKO84456.1 hypothetical protein BDK51DRAFT_49056 [Blyttiomyces helicus]